MPHYICFLANNNVGKVLYPANKNKRYSSNVNRTFVQSYLGFNNVLKTLARKHPTYVGNIQRSNGSCTDLRLPGGHLGMDERTSPTAQPGKDWASCRPCHSDSTAWLLDSIRHINNYPINFSQKSWCNLWWPADLQRAHCKDCSILQVCATQHQKNQALSDRACCTNFLSRPLSFLGWTTAMLFWLDFPSNTIKPLQMIQNAAARLVFNDPQNNPCYHLSSSHCTGYQWQLTSSSRHWCLHTERPQAQHYFHSLLRIYIPSRSLRSASERRLVVPSQRGSKSLSRTFSFTIPGWWNNLPTPIRNAGSLSIFKQQLKTHLFRHYLTSS